jgi:UDP-N-acetyl-D-galactosamine dehydrogenase
LANPQDVKHEYGIELTAMEALRPANAVILAVAHEPYVRGGWPLLARLLKDGSGIVLDVKSQLDRSQRPQGIDLWRL